MDIQDLAQKLPLPEGIEKAETRLLGISEKAGYLRGFKKGLGIGLGIAAVAVVASVVVPKVKDAVAEKIDGDKEPAAE